MRQENTYFSLSVQETKKRNAVNLKLLTDETKLLLSNLSFPPEGEKYAAGPYVMS